MIEKFFTQSEWFGINFSETKVDLNSNEMASPYFYGQFYRLLEERFSSISQLPKDWLKGKQDTAKALSQLLQMDSKILSYGCGLGVVEKYLIENHNYKQLFGYDSAKQSKINYSNPDFIRLTQFEELEYGRFDYIYLCQVLYAFDKNEAIQLLKVLNNLLKEGGSLILVNSSISDLENGVSKRKAQRNRIISKIRRELNGISKSKVKNKASEQGWGYQRNNEYYQFLITEAGFNSVTFLPLARQSFALCQK